MDWLGAHNFGAFHAVLNFGSSPQLPSCENPNDVLIKVSYSDVNPVDLQKLSGGRQEGQEVPNPPFIPGFGGTGIVEQVGSAAPQHLVGKPVVFISDKPGSYASHALADSRCVAELPANVDPRDAATIPVAGLTAYEVLAKLGLVRDNVKIVKEEGKIDTIGVVPVAADSTEKHSIPKSQSTSENDAKAAMLIVGGSGGVGSWILTFMVAWHPHIKVIVTASPGASQDWCKQLGASQAIGHTEIGTKLEGGKNGSVEYIVCLSEPTKNLFDTLSDVIKPYGHIALVVAGKSIETLNLGFCFFKCVNVVTQTVFSSIRTDYKHFVPAEELQAILRLLGNQTIRAPLSPDLETTVSEKFKDALKDDGVLYRMQNGSRRGKFVLRVNAGDSLIFLDFKTGSLIPIPRKDYIAQKVLLTAEAVDPKKSNASKKPKADGWKEEAKTEIERQQLIDKVSASKSLGIVKIAEKQWTDYEDGIEMQEAENVKNLWGVQLKKREKNKKGEEFMFVDPRSGAIGEISRQSFIDKGIMTIATDDDGKEAITEAITAADERSNLAQQIRQALKLHLEAGQSK